MRKIVMVLALAGLAACDREEREAAPVEPAKPAALSWEGGDYARREHETPRLR